MVHLAKHMLENEDIECVVRGEYLAASFGAGAGVDAWVELWIVNEYQSEAARSLIEELLEEEDAVDDQWICPDCIEWRDGPFSHCWKCGAERVR